MSGTQQTKIRTCAASVNICDEARERMFLVSMVGVQHPFHVAESKDDESPDRNRRTAR